MVLGKRTRSSLASSSSSTTTESSQSTTKSDLSTPYSSVPSPAPSLKRARTRFANSVPPIEEFNNKENVAPLNWFVCGRSATPDVDASRTTGEGDDTDEETPESPVRPGSRLVPSESRTTGHTGSRLARTRSAPATVSETLLDTPPATPRKLNGRTASQPTPSGRLSKLTISQSSADESEAMDIDEAITPECPSENLSPYSQARKLLRCVASTRLDDSPSVVIAAREVERATIRDYIIGGNFLEPGANKGSPSSSLYISGSPGTGKTALVSDVLNQLASGAHERPPTAVYVNCMGIHDIKALWNRVWEEMVESVGGSTGSKLKPGDGQRYLEDALRSRQDLRCILVLDELDYISRSAAALSEVYQLAHKYPYSLRLIGISNTLTLGSEALSLPTKSTRATTTPGCGPQKSLNFAAYTAADLQTIINARLASLDSTERTALFNPTALSFLCKKVAAVNGDVRFALSVLRRCLDSAEKDGSPAKKGRLEMRHVLESLKAHESGNAACAGDSKGSGIPRTVRGLGLHARLALVALLVGWKRLDAGLSLAGQSATAKQSTTLSSTGLYSYYVNLLTASIIDDEGNSNPSTPFNPVSRNEFQDIVGVLETSGLMSFTMTPPTATRSFSCPSMAASSLPLTPPKTPTKPRPSGLSRTVSSNGIGRKKAAIAEPSVILTEGVREDDVVRGLTTSVGNEANAAEKELERLWARELKRVAKDVEKRDRKEKERLERERLDAMTFDD